MLSVCVGSYMYMYHFVVKGLCGCMIDRVMAFPFISALFILRCPLSYPQVLLWSGDNYWPLIK